MKKYGLEIFVLRKTRTASGHFRGRTVRIRTVVPPQREPPASRWSRAMWMRN